MALTKYNFNSFDVTPVASNAFAFDGDADALATAGAGAMNLISTSTVSSGVSAVSITSGIDSTYHTYIFKFISMHGQTDDRKFQFNLSADGGSNYNVTKTSTSFRSYHNEGDSATVLHYAGGSDLAQGTGVQHLSFDGGADADQTCSGTLHLFNPSNTTFVKHYVAETSTYGESNYMNHCFVGGYGNTTSAINAIQFTFATGNIDSGIIKMYGISK